MTLSVISNSRVFGLIYAGGDGYCGNSMEPAEAIEETGLVYMPDIHSSLTVYPEESAISVPARLTCRRNAFSQSTVLKKTGRFWAWTGGGHGIIG